MTIEDDVVASLGTNLSDVGEQRVVLACGLDLVFELECLTPFGLHLFPFPIDGVTNHFIELFHCSC